MNFNDLNVENSLVRALNKMNIVTPTEIQAQSIPKIINNPETHVIAQAKTGSGKTIAFATPIAQLAEQKLQEVQAVIIVPTRELCKQVANVFDALSQYKKLKIVQVYGGVSINRQIDLIREGGQIIVATPGRLIDLYDRGRISFNHVKFVVLDEADRCLDMGFIPDIEYLLLDAMKNVKPRLFLFSATIFREVFKLAEKFTKGKNVITIDVSQDKLTVKNCNQYYYLIEHFRDKYYHFRRILKKEHPKHFIIFVNTKKTGDWLYHRLRKDNKIHLKMELISGNLSQKRREHVLASFRKKRINCLIATDVAARGLDIKGVSHVFNYDLPKFEENYVHRIGRTARISGIKGEYKKGTAISLVMKENLRILSRIEALVKKKIQRKPLPPRKGRHPRKGRTSRSQKRKEDKRQRRNFLY